MKLWENSMRKMPATFKFISVQFSFLCSPLLHFMHTQIYKIIITDMTCGHHHNKTEQLGGNIEMDIQCCASLHKNEPSS